MTTPNSTTTDSTSNKDDDAASSSDNLATLRAFFAAINNYSVEDALQCCHDDISVTYPDPGRNWQGKQRGKIVMTGIFQMMQAQNLQVTYQVVVAPHKDDDNSNKDPPPINTLTTRENWGNPRIHTTSIYTFRDGRILSIAS